MTSPTPEGAARPHANRGLKLTEPVTPEKIVEFVAWYRGGVAATDSEIARLYADRTRLIESYVRDMTRVLDALELVATPLHEREGA